MIWPPVKAWTSKVSIRGKKHFVAINYGGELLNKWVIMIHGMTEPWFEFQHKCIHVHNSEVCNGCWHRDETLRLKGDWNVCPDHKGTNREFECSKEITPPMVFDAIDKVKGKTNGRR